MRFRDEAVDLVVETRTDGYELSEREKQGIDADLEGLRRVVRDFPVAQLHIDIRRHAQRGDFHVKTRLHVSKRNLFTGERDTVVTRAVERCVRKLIKKVESFKERHSGKPEIRRTAGEVFREVTADAEPNLAALETAARDGDFDAFCDAISPYDDSLSRRVGRWIARYPDLEVKLGDSLVIGDIIDEIHFAAFEGFSERPTGSLGAWLEELIDPIVRSLSTGPGH